MKAQRIQLWVALVCLSAGAFMIHYKMHPPTANLTHFWASFFCGLDVILVSILFLSKDTAVWALLLNSFLAFLGIIMMTDLTIVSTFEGWIKASPTQQPVAWFLESMFPDIIILVADFLAGLALFQLTIVQRSE